MKGDTDPSALPSFLARCERDGGNYIIYIYIYIFNLNKKIDDLCICCVFVLRKEINLLKLNKHIDQKN